MAASPTIAPVDLSDERFHDEGRIPLRLRVGVTGHRQIAHHDDVVTAVREQLTHLDRRFPASAAMPVTFQIVSALAEGADRLVFAEARRLFSDTRVQLHAILPRPRADYTRDFRSPQSRQEFEELLRLASLKYVIPSAKNDDDAYRLAGQEVVDRSDLVIALWDGGPQTESAGTAATVNYAKAEQVPVLVIPTARIIDHDLDRTAAAAAAAAELDHNPLAVTHRRLIELNRPSLHGPRLRRSLEEQVRRLDLVADGTEIRGHYETVAEWALPRLIRADHLALKYQRLHYRLGTALYVLAAAALTTVAAQSQAGWSPKFALVEVACMLLALGTFGIARWLQVHERWLGYRSLAEALRSSLFLVLAGARARSGLGRTSADDEEARWFRRIFAEAWTDRRPATLSDREAPALSAFLNEAWIKDQIRYHREAVRQYARRRNQLTATVFGLFAVTTAIAVLHALTVGGEEVFPNIFVFLTIAVPGFGAALTGIRDQRQYRLHEDRSQRAATRLQGLSERMAAQSELADIRKLARQVQVAIEAESVDWRGVMEFQDVELVI